MELEEKIEGRTVVIGVIGLGYVGLPLAVSFLRVGVRVLGFDIDKEKIASISQGESYLTTLSSRDLSRYVEEGIFSATADFSRLSRPLLPPFPSGCHPDMRAYPPRGGEGAGSFLRDQHHQGDIEISSKGAVGGVGVNHLSWNYRGGPSSYSGEGWDEGRRGFLSRIFPRTRGSRKQALSDVAYP